MNKKESIANEETKTAPAESAPAATTAAAPATNAVRKPAAVKKPMAGVKPAAAEIPQAPAKVKSAPVKETAQSPAKSGGKKSATKKSKPVRDSFTFPEADYALFGVLKQRAIKAGCEIKKSELLRAGLMVLNAMPDEQLTKVLGSVERIKTGRPNK